MRKQEDRNLITVIYISLCFHLKHVVLEILTKNQTFLDIYGKLINSGIQLINMGTYRFEILSHQRERSTTIWLAAVHGELIYANFINNT